MLGRDLSTLCSILGLCAALAGPGFGQQPIPPRNTQSVAQDTPRQVPGGTTIGEGGIISVSAESRQFVFSVLGRDGKLVRGLTEKDIEFYDGGAPQDIDIFRESNDLPMMLSILIDTSGSQESLLTTEKRAVDRFLSAFLRDGVDYGSIVTFQGNVNLVNGLTSNQNRLKSSLGRIEREQPFRDEDGGAPELGTALADALFVAVREILDGPTAQRLTTVSGGKEAQRRAIRRAVIVLTDGKDTASQRSLARATIQAQRRGIAVYALGMGDRFRYGDVDRETLDKLCADTGGRAFYPRSEDELDQAFKSIVGELTSQYVILYRPVGGSANPDGFRKTEVIFKENRRFKAIHGTGYNDSTEK